MQEPGLDKHEWETQWEGLEPLIADAPGEALSEVDDLVARMIGTSRSRASTFSAREICDTSCTRFSGFEPEVISCR